MFCCGGLLNLRLIKTIANFQFHNRIDISQSNIVLPLPLKTVAMPIKTVARMSHELVFLKR